MGKTSKRPTGFKSDGFAPKGRQWSGADRPEAVEKPGADEILSEGIRVPRLLVHKIDIQPTPGTRIAWPLLAGVVLGAIAAAVTILVVTSRPPQSSPGGPRGLTVLAKPKTSVPVPMTQPAPPTAPLPAVQRTPAAASDSSSRTSVPPPAGRIEPDTLALLLKRGADLIALGDVTAARSVFRYAAETGEARAAFALAETYDPLVLRRLGVRGVAPDVANARLWYDRAMQLGSREAPGRLELLARQSE